MKLLTLTTMYPGSLASFYRANPSVKEMDYRDHLNLLLNESTEFGASYYRNFNKLGIQAACIVANDDRLQNKWTRENSLSGKRHGIVLQNQIREQDPEVLLIENLGLVDTELINSIRRENKNLKLIAGYHCAPAGLKILRMMKQVDLMITCTPGLAETYSAKGIKTFMVYHGFDEDILTKLNSTRPGNANGKIVFSGSLTTGGQFHNERIRLINHLLNAGLGVELFVNTENNFRVSIKSILHTTFKGLKIIGLEKLAMNSIFVKGKDPIIKYSPLVSRNLRKPMFGIEMMELFNRSDIVLNYHIGAAGNYAGNMRMFEATGCGTCLLTDNKKNIGDLFDPYSEIVVYDNAEDCAEKAKWLINNPSSAKNIASAGQKRTLACHTVRNRCETILEIFEREIRNQ